MKLLSSVICCLVIAGPANARDIFRHPKPKDVPALIKHSSSKHEKHAPVRRSAVRALARVGAPAVPELIRALRDQDRDESLASQALALIGQPAVEPLIAVLRGPDKQHRDQAATALAWVGKPAISALVKMLQDKDPEVRYRAVWAFQGMERLPRAVEALAAATSDSDANVRAGGIIILGEMRADAEKSIAALANAVLKDKDPHNRGLAADSLGEIGPAAKSAVPALTQALKDKDRDVRYDAVQALGLIGPAAEPAVPALIQALKDKDRDVRDEAVQALGRIGRGAKRAVPALIQIIKNKAVNWRGIGALGGIGPAAKALIPSLVELRRHKDARVAEAATEALSRIAADAEHVSLLIEIYTDKKFDGQGNIQEPIESTFRKIGEAAVPALMKALRKADPRRPIIQLLVIVGRPAVPALIKALQNQNKQVRDSVVRILSEIGPDAEKAIPALAAEMNDKNPQYRWAVIHALAFIGDSRRVRVSLISAFGDRSAKVRHYAVYLFALNWPDETNVIVEKALPMLARDLQQADAEFHPSAARTLAWASLCVGPKATPFVLAALDHKNPDVRFAVLSEYGSYYMNWLRLNPLFPLKGPPISPLKKALKDKDADVRAMAKSLLDSATGHATKTRDAPKTVAGLLKILHEPRNDPWNRIGAARNLHTLDPKRAAVEAVPLLVDYLGDKFEESIVRAAAAEALGFLGSKTPLVQAALRRAIQDVDKEVTAQKLDVGLMHDLDVWLWCEFALIKLGTPDRAKRIAGIIGVVREGRDWSATAAHILGELGREAKAAVPALTEALKHDWPELQWAAAQALKQIDPQTAKKAGLK